LDTNTHDKPFDQLSPRVNPELQPKAKPTTGQSLNVTINTLLQVSPSDENLNLPRFTTEEDIGFHGDLFTNLQVDFADLQPASGGNAIQSMIDPSFQDRALDH
jgi:hypothetical protein